MRKLNKYLWVGDVLIVFALVVGVIGLYIGLAFLLFSVGAVFWVRGLLERALRNPRTSNAIDDA